MDSDILKSPAEQLLKSPAEQLLKSPAEQLLKSPDEQLLKKMYTEFRERWNTYPREYTLPRELNYIKMKSNNNVIY